MDHFQCFPFNYYAHKTILCTIIFSLLQVYRKPLKNEVSTELSTDDIKHLFGPLSAILEHHELFFAALSEQTKNWSPAKLIGDIFLASVSTINGHLHVCHVIIFIFSLVGRMWLGITADMLITLRWL